MKFNFSPTFSLMSISKTYTTILFLIGTFLFSLPSFSDTSSGKPDPILTRHDKEQDEFYKIAERFEQYICHLNLPDCEGTIIADQWAISAAHCAVGIMEKFRNGRKHFVIINDVEIEVDKVIMFKEWENYHLDLIASNDIALLHLKTKPLNAIPAKLYVEEDEVDKLVYMVGGGDKGNGLLGVNGNDGKQRGATNRIESVSEEWLTWTFDHPDTQTKYLTEYEGISGPGDSGGPAFILKNGDVYLAGISSWQDQKEGDEGLYGVVENYTRVSQYIKWITDEMNESGGDSEEMLRVEVKPDAIDGRPKAIYVNATTLKQYVGEYEIQGITVKVYTNENDTKLYVSVPDQPPYELIPTAEHLFSFRVLEGFELEFRNMENGVFKELVGIQPDGTYIATRK